MKAATIIYLMIIFTWIPVSGQKLIVSGKIVDGKSLKEIPYATVGIYNDNEELIGGTSDTENGQFSFKTNSFSYLIISFIGYQNQKIFHSQLEEGKEVLVELLPNTDHMPVQSLPVLCSPAGSVRLDQPHNQPSIQS